MLVAGCYFWMIWWPCLISWRIIWYSSFKLSYLLALALFHKKFMVCNCAPRVNWLIHSHTHMKHRSYYITPTHHTLTLEVIKSVEIYTYINLPVRLIPSCRCKAIFCICTMVWMLFDKFWRATWLVTLTFWFKERVRAPCDCCCGMLLLPLISAIPL